MKFVFIPVLAVVVGSWLCTSDVLARGGGRAGGGPGAGGGGRPAVGGGGRPSPGAAASHVPSMSRPAGKPVANRPSVGSNRADLGGKLPGRPDLGGSRPQLPAAKPDLGSKLPGKPDLGGKLPGKPDLGGKLPATLPGKLPSKPDLGTLPGTRPSTLPGKLPGKPDLGGKLPNWPGGDGRPKPGDRPSAGDLKDFLDLPGGPGDGHFPGLGGNKPDLGDKIQIGDRTKVGDINISTGDKITVNHQNNINSIRNKYNHIDRRPFDRDWWGPAHVGGAHWHWHAGWNRYPANWCWRPCTWAAFGTWFTWTWAQPYPYDYGTTVVYRDNYVYVNDKQYVTTEQYYQQAATMATSLPKDVAADKVEWMPLGVFAIAEAEADDTGMLLQLAVSKEGILAGTFYNETGDVSRPVEGMVDQKSQRAAWRFADGKNEQLVMETGIVNLTKDEATALLHFGQDRKETWTLVRLPAPEGEQ